MTNDEPQRPSAFGRALKAERERHRPGLTQTELGEQLGSRLRREVPYSQGTISAWEGGATPPSPSEVFTIEQILKVPPGHLSRHLGYMPITGVVDVTNAVENDPLLDDDYKEILLDLYRSLIRQTRA